DLAVAELVEMPERQFRSPFLIEDNVGDSVDLLVSGDCNSRKNSDTLPKSGIDEDKALDGAVHEKARILFDEIRLAAVAGGQIKVALFNQVFLYTAQYLRSITIAEFGNEHTDRKGL